MLFALVLTLSGCVPVFNIYRYISLDDFKDAKVVERGPVSPGDGSFFIGDVPWKYLIERPDYTIELRTNWYDVRPSFEIFLRRSRSDTVPTKLEFTQPSPGPDCAKAFVQDRFGHSLGFSANDCPNGKRNSFVIRLSVFNTETGERIGEEEIPFRIKRKGVSFYIDAL